MAAAAHKPGGPTDPSHDEKLRRGIIVTQVSRASAAGMVGAFLLLICGIPLVQGVAERVKGDDSMLLDIFKHKPTKDTIKQYEKDLEEASYVRDYVRPRLQLVITKYGGFGNSKGVVGRAGWLYYKPGVMSLSGPGFLDPDTHAAGRKAALDDGNQPPQQDPRPAVLAMSRALQERGIALVLFPVPDKAMLEPAHLHGRVDSSKPTPVTSNRDYAAFVSQMRAEGVLVFDPSPTALLPGQPDRYLAQDTHWTPAFMDQVASKLASFVTESVVLSPPESAPRWKAVKRAVSRVGDIVDMLKLPDGQTLFAPQTIDVEIIQDQQGNDWQPNQKADVLLLGDSFTNIYSQPAMGWGEAAGLAPHLARALGRDLDVIAQNDSGAFATRKLLSEALHAGEDRLAGKRVVIWEFAARELATGDWKPYSLALGKAP